MKSLLLALQFLTIIPVKVSLAREDELAKSMICFPLIGLLLGLALVGIDNLFLNLNFPEFSINIILVISLVILTGGMHLDGLADTADALLSRKSKEEMLTIMRDPHIGVMGVLAIISMLLLKSSFLSTLGISSKMTALLLMCILSRWSMVFTIFLFPYAREEGKAKTFTQGITLKIFILATIITLIPVIAIWRIKGLLVLMIIAGVNYIFGKAMDKKIGGITGDTLGAAEEITEVIILFSICILERGNLWII
ncbi:MAG: adenosylcobinamide-GDP ribazoletransferase [Candidatus Omnitrophica bacterium]|nr:adenosylcobinamide-GDP ribazoletransferase [Candidatus Omnitrophota bacterium]MDD5591744.1 adenosylcobinamide-GDP ribazoletransferase [Candidatus Omnitrophota bacterium]